MKRLVAHTSDSKLREFHPQSSDANLRLFVTFFGEEEPRQVFYICVDTERENIYFRQVTKDNCNAIL
jgi:hypothetical protein